MPDQKFLGYDSNYARTTKVYSFFERFGSNFQGHVEDFFNEVNMEHGLAENARDELSGLQQIAQALMGREPFMSWNAKNLRQPMRPAEQAVLREALSFPIKLGVVRDELSRLATLFPDRKTSFLTSAQYLSGIADAVAKWEKTRLGARDHDYIVKTDASGVKAFTALLVEVIDTSVQLNQVIAAMDDLSKLRRRLDSAQSHLWSRLWL